MPAPSATLAVATPPDSLTPAEALAAAKQLRPIVLEQAAETEARTYYSEDLHLRFLRAGLYNQLRPKLFGGPELDLVTFFRVTRELARGDMATAWSFTLAAGHVLWLAAWWPEEAQRQVFTEPHTAAAGTFNPSGELHRVAGGWRLSGVFPYASGIPYSTHFIGHSFPVYQDGSRGAPSAFVVPRSAFTIRDDWGRTLGLRGSGSHTIDIVDAFVPDAAVFENRTITDTEIEGGTPGYRLHRNPLYNTRAVGFFSLELASLGIGAAWAALDEYRTMLTTKRTPLPPIVLRGEHPTYQAWYADAYTGLMDAETTIDACAALYAGYATAAAAGAPFTPVDDSRIGRLGFEAQMKAWRVVESILMRTAGSSALVTGSRIERIWRDMSMLHSHQNSILQDVLAPTFAQGLLAEESAR